MTILNYDEHGFIIGMRRVERGVKDVRDDTQEIIQILKSQAQINNTRLTQIARNTGNIASNTGGKMRSASQPRISGESRPGRSNVTSPTPSTDNKRSSRPSRSSADNTDHIIRSASRSATRASDNNPNNGVNGNDEAIRGLSRRARIARPSRESRRNDNADDRSSQGGRLRDERGRFIGGGDSDDKKDANNLGKLIDAIHKGLGGSINSQGVDPLVDSVNEMRQVFTPLTRGAKFAGRAAKWSWSKFKARKRKEPLPRDEERHNRENEKLLKRILEKIKSGGSNGLGLLGKMPVKALGLLAGAGGLATLLGRGGKSILGGLRNLKGLKFLGPLAALAGVGDLAMNWGNLDHEGKSAGVGGLVGGGAGAIAGASIGTMIFPGVGTVVGGAVGAWLGNEGGEWLGRTASPYIQLWTNSLVAYDLPGKMSEFWQNGMRPFFARMSEVASTMKAWAEQKMSELGSFANGVAGLAADALGLDSAELGSLSAKYESGGRGVGTISSGKGDKGGVSYGAHQLASKTGTMAAYLRSAEGKPFAGYFAGLAPGSAAFNARYKEVVASKGAEFAASQKNFITRTHYAPSAAHAQKLGFKMSNRGVQEAIYSGSVQHGKFRTGVLDKVAKMPGFANMTAEQQLDALYDVRTAYAVKHAGASNERGLRNRYAEERQLAKQLARQDQDKQAVVKKVEDTKEAVKGAVTSAKDKAVETATAAKNKVVEFFETPVDKAIDSKLKEQGYDGLGKPAVEKPSFMKGDSFMPTASTNMIKRFMPATSTLSLNIPEIARNTGIKLPPMPKLTQRLDSSAQQPIVIQANSESIPQNVSDRGLAHAITGGIGFDARYA